MKRIPQGRYTKELRQEAVKLIIKGKLSWSKQPGGYRYRYPTIGDWMKAYKADKLEDAGKNYRPLTEVEMELARVKRENATLKMRMKY